MEQFPLFPLINNQTPNTRGSPMRFNVHEPMNIFKDLIDDNDDS
jgi:hypothetical protein